MMASMHILQDELRAASNPWTENFNQPKKINLLSYPCFPTYVNLLFETISDRNAFW